MQTNKLIDLLIIGGGINGCGIAADASGSGLSVMLCEQEDLANATSSYSSKLIHGGLRYLEHGKLCLVRKALAEREILLRKAPHIIRPIEFVIPHHQELRSHWLIRLGLFLYDHMGFRKLLPKSKRIDLQSHPMGQPLKPEYKMGFTYADCQVDDSRLVILNAMAAKENGATILTRHKVIQAKRNNGHWEVTIENQKAKEKFIVYAKGLVNASGPWVMKTLQEINCLSKNKITLVKGSHIVVPKFYLGNHGYVLQHEDRRIIFVMPFEEKYNLIGTTEILYRDDPADAKITEQEKHYLCAAVNRYFKKPLTLDDIVWDYAGVRPLLHEKSDKPSAITRDYILEFDDKNHRAPLLTIFGGKITTYRKLAEQALKLFKPYFPEIAPSYTRKSFLPGGEIDNADFQKFVKTICKLYAWLPQSLAMRYAKNYGTRVHTLLVDASSLSELGIIFGADLYQKEVDYLIKNEWAQSAEDILWRRTKLGISFSDRELAKLNRYVTA